MGWLEECEVLRAAWRRGKITKRRYVQGSVRALRAWQRISATNDTEAAERRMAMTDKRDECGCHRECTNLPHECEKACRWPACLTAAEEAELIAELEADETLGGPVEPVLPLSRDGIYPRCVWCRGENYALAVLAYSAGEHPCAAVGGCGRYLPESYRQADR